MKQAFPLTVGPPSANSDEPGNNQACKSENSLPGDVLRLTNCWMGGNCWCIQLQTILTFPRSARGRSFPSGFLCAKMALAYVQKNNTVKFPLFCIRASSTIGSAFGWVRMGRLWLFKAFFSFWVGFNLNSVLNLMSILTLAKLSTLAPK